MRPGHFRRRRKLERTMRCPIRSTRGRHAPAMRHRRRSLGRCPMPAGGPSRAGGRGPGGQCAVAAGRSPDRGKPAPVGQARGAAAGRDPAGGAQPGHHPRQWPADRPIVDAGRVFRIRASSWARSGRVCRGRSHSSSRRVVHCSGQRDRPDFGSRGSAPAPAGRLRAWRSQGGGGFAAIGRLEDASKVLQGQTGTRIIIHDEPVA